MNKVILMGRLTRDPKVTYSQGDNTMAVARFTLAVDRRGRKDANGDGTQTADFISCVAFRTNAEFIEKYFRQGMRVLISGRIQTGSYVNKEGQTVYRVEVVAENIEFAESKSAAGKGSTGQQDSDGFMDIPDGVDDQLPFN